MPGMLLRTVIVLILFLPLPVVSNGQQLLINEFKPFSDPSASDQWYTNPWIELRNASTSPVYLSDYRLSFDSVNFFALRNKELYPNEYEVIYFGGTGPAGTFAADSSFPDTARVIYLLSDSTVSKVIVPDGITATESYGRYPEDSNEWIFFAEGRQTPGGYNEYPGPWQKVAARTAFSPRDSSPNGVLVYNDKIWILEGYRLIQPDIYYSTSDIYSSSDGANWTLINANPPYNPYSAFIVFDGWMWAFEYRAYRSKDGIHWEDAGPTPLSLGGRIALHNGKLFWTSGSDLYTSSDGLNWEAIFYNGPWGKRAWPGFQSLNGKLWLFGGASNLNTGSPTYHNDVWSSTDGISWVQEIQHADFPGRYWFGSHVYDNKLWILGGYSYYVEVEGSDYRGNLDDIWYSEDGVHWFELDTGTWPHRHAPFSWVLGDNLFVSSGAHGGNGKILLNDVWRFEKETLTATRLEKRLTSLTYGDTITVPLVTETGAEITYLVEDPTMVSFGDDQMFLRDVGQTILHMHTNPGLLHKGGDINLPLSIGKRTLHVRPKDTVRLFGDSNPPFELVYDGFIWDDNESDITQLPSVSTDASMFSPLGQYQLLSEGGESKRYSMIHGSGTLKVDGKSELVVFPIPCRSYMNIIHSDSKKFIRSVKLVNSAGVITLDERVNDHHVTLDVTGLRKGIYTMITSFVSQYEKPVIRKIIITD